MIKITLGTDKQERPNPVVFLRIGDGNADGLKVTVLNEDTPVNLTDYVVSFEGVTSNGKTIVDSNVKIIDAEKGQFEYTFPEQASQSSGKYVRAYFSFTKGNQRTTTENLEVSVYDATNLNEISPVNYINPYNQLIGQLQNAFQESTNKLTDDVTAFKGGLNSQEEGISKQLQDLGTKISDYIEGRNVEFVDFKTQFAQLVKNVQSEVATMQGPKGDPGEQGAPGAPGVQGPKGDPGTSVTIKGSFSGASDLPMTASISDGYLVGTDLYIWDGKAWIDGGPVRGPQGIPGEQGEPGVAGEDGKAGEKGNPGDGITLKGSVASIDELPAIATDGDAYLLNTQLYVWSKLKWNLQGDIRGPKGETGEAGLDGENGITQDISNLLPWDKNTKSIDVETSFIKQATFSIAPLVLGNKVPVYSSVVDEETAKTKATELSSSGLVGLVGWTEG